MRSRLFLTFALLLGPLVVLLGCGSDPNCPTCGTTINGTYRIIDVIPVPEHNPTGEPGGPFNSFDISWIDPVNHRFYVSDRIGLDVPVMDTINNVAMFSIGGDNVVSTGGLPSPCDPTANPPIPFLQTAFNPLAYNPTIGISSAFDLTRFGCRTDNPPGCSKSGAACIYAFNLYGQFGASGDFGGWAGAQCCASRSNGVNPISCPCGEVVTADGNFLVVGNSSSSVVVFDLRPMLADLKAGKTFQNVTPPVIIATIPTGASPDFDGPEGVAPCIVAWTGRAGSDPTCGDDRADEMSLGENIKFADGSVHDVLMVDNGDPGQPFVTLIDLTEVIGGTGTPVDPLGGAHCYPRNANAPYNTVTNPPKCIIGQITYDGGTVDSPCTAATGSVAGVAGVTPSSGFLDKTPVPSGIPGAPCVHSNIAPAGLGGSTFNPNTGHFLTTNPNSQGDPHFGTVEEINPDSAVWKACTPAKATCGVILNTLVLNSCMPGGVVMGPGNQALVGCIDHDGVAFAPNEFIINANTLAVITSTDQVGGVDETWYNPGDNRYYVAARDMSNGPKLGVIDAGSLQWLENVPTNSNSHSVSVEPANNHVFVPLQSGGPCGTSSSAGCVGVFARE